MKAHEVPFNLGIMNLTPDRLRLMKPVRALDIFEGGTDNFHEEGLFSTSIFGRVGSDDRDKRFSYIDVRVAVFHPFVFKNLVRLKGLYRAIMSGRGYAKWDAKLGDFVQSDELNGETGFHFFVSHWKEIKFRSTGSDVRDMRIKMIEKYRDNAMTDKVLVLPAGLRDVQMDADGRYKSDEVNDHYARLIGISNTIGRNINSPVIDVSRWSLQMAFNALYDHMESMISGKSKFIQKKWARRKVFNTTRNVLSTMDTCPEQLGAANAIGPNDTVVGLYQTMKGVLPMTKYYLRQGIVGEAFNTPDGNVSLVNPKTLKKVLVKVSQDTMNRWTSNDGLEKLINAFADQAMRSREVEIEGHYLALIYLGPDKTFKIFKDIDELPEGFNREHVKPITWVEMFYLSQYNRWYDYGVYVTRYPVTGEGSTYPSKVYVKTTIVGEQRRELGVDWQPMEGDEYVAREFPSRKLPVHLDSLIPHTSRLGGLGADFDGDTGSANYVYTEEAMKEVDEYLNTRRAYVHPNGGLKASPVVHTTKLVITNMTGD